MALDLDLDYLTPTFIGQGWPVTRYSAEIFAYN